MAIGPRDDASSYAPDKADTAIEFAHQAERLGAYSSSQDNAINDSTHAVEAHFVTGQDPVIETANGGRLPAVPLSEAKKLNHLKDVLEDRDPSESNQIQPNIREGRDGTVHGVKPIDEQKSEEGAEPGAPLREAVPSYRTDPLFPPLPMYGPPTFLKNVQCIVFRISSAILSLQFLLVIILGAVFTSIPIVAKRVWIKATCGDPDRRRPFYEEEQRRKKERQNAERVWEQETAHKHSSTGPDSELDAANESEFVPLEGGLDRLLCDVGYYARRIGLDCETFDVQTEDGFIIELWHIYNPREYTRKSEAERKYHSPDIFTNPPTVSEDASESKSHSSNKRYPVLMIHGLLQSAGAYCCNDDDSLAFYLAKAGYDVWLGNNRCGFRPRHTLLKYGDPRMWAWNIRQMGVMDLPALISRVLTETGFPKLGLVAHSQGTTQTLIALAKEQRPEIGEKISVFCGLAPAAYAGPLIGKMYFKFMRVINPAMFRAMFGIHAFIPLMMSMHAMLPGHLYGKMGYLIFSFLFNWTDERWDRGLRDRFFKFAPVYVSAESMRWWLGRECFATQKCILATREEKKIEDQEDAQIDHQLHDYFEKGRGHPHPSEEVQRDSASDSDSPQIARKKSIPHKSKEELSRFSWYGPQAPPMALWVCGNDDLVDGRRLLRRFERGREPHVNLIHSKIIEGYEHLDVLWAMDAIEKVGKEVKEVIWQTVSEGIGGRASCRVPTGCEDVEVWKPDGKKQQHTGLDSSAGEWNKGEKSKQ